MAGTRRVLLAPDHGMLGFSSSSAHAMFGFSSPGSLGPLLHYRAKYLLPPMFADINVSVCTRGAQCAQTLPSPLAGWKSTLQVRLSTE